MASGDIHLGDFNVGSVDRLRFTITKDGEPWAGIDSAVLAFLSPDQSTAFSRTMTLEDDETGVWYYDTTTSEIDIPGDWHLGLRVTDGVIIKRYPGRITLRVHDQPE